MELGRILWIELRKRNIRVFEGRERGEIGIGVLEMVLSIELWGRDRIEMKEELGREKRVWVVIDSIWFVWERMKLLESRLV